MLIGFYKKSYLFQYVFLVLISGLLWIGSFMKPAGLIPETDPMTQPAYALLIYVIGYNDLVGKIIAFTLMLILAFLFNQILIQHELAPKNTLLPALVFIILNCHSEELLTLEPALIAGALLLLVLHYLFQVYTEEEAYGKLFNAGILTSIASFIYLPSAFFILFIWFTLIVFRLFKWREWIIPFIGMALPYLFLFTGYFWFDKLIPALESYFRYFTSLFPITFRFETDIINYLITGIIAVLFLWSLLRTAAEIQEKNIGIRKRFWSVFWFFFISFMIFVFGQFEDKSHLVLLAIPLSVYISRGFGQVRKKIWLELLFGLLFILIVFNSLKSLLITNG